MNNSPSKSDLTPPQESDQIQEHDPEQVQPEPWLGRFLRRTFFGQCSVHDSQKNDLNRYCIDCDLEACRYCISSGSHGNHGLLKIYRHVYKDVVPLADMENHIDCKKIQRYRSNKKEVIALNPLPHCGSGEACKETSCDFCSRKLFEPNNYRFCSIACQINASTSGEPGAGAAENEASAAENDANKEPTKNPLSFRKRSRKGIPCRAPFF